jgi:hypothetical protein
MEQLMTKIARRFERFFAAIGAFLDAALFRTTMTVEDDIAQRDKQTQKELYQCEAAIARYRYLQHLAVSERRALRAWQDGQVLEPDGLDS